MSRLDIVIVTWNSSDDIRGCLTVLGEPPPIWQVWVVDNGSTDETVAVVRAEFPWVHVVANGHNLGFARANNQVIAQTDSDYVLLLNPDTELTVETVAAALHEIEQMPRAGVLGVQLRNTDRSLQPSCFHFPTPWLSFVESTGLHWLFPREWRSRHLLAGYWDHGDTRKVDWIMGAFMLARREAIKRVGAVPETSFIFGEDMDWCYRMWRGNYEVWFTPATSIIHHCNRSAGQLPSSWRAERTHRATYDFCRVNYGRFAMKFKQVLDVIGYSGRWLRYRWSRTKTGTYRFQLMDIGLRTALREFKRSTG